MRFCAQFNTLFVLTLASILIFPIITQAQGGMDTGVVRIDVTNVIGYHLPAKVVFKPEDSEQRTQIVRLPEGRIAAHCPPGDYKAYVWVYDWDIPLLANTQNVSVRAGQESYVLVELLQGSSPNMSLRDFDQDGDLVLDSVEMAENTNPGDPTSYPGAIPIPFDNIVLSDKPGWYKGDLHIRSSHGDGSQTVRQIIQRAERARLDFIAITDRNSIAALEDSDYKSNRVVLIPAMEWGNDDLGVALIYGMRTLPELTDHIMDAQGVVYRVQSQGGVFSAAHPCFYHAPWQRGLSYLNAIQVWAREWRKVPPISLDRLTERNVERDSERRLIHSIAIAAATPMVCANGQAEVFWDNELQRGLQASALAGSYSSSSKVAIGRPVTYVYAPEKSAEGILYGMRMGRTFVSSEPNGAQVYIQADILGDGNINAEMGDPIPVGLKSYIYVTVVNAPGAKLQVIQDGRLIVSKNMEERNIVFRFPFEPQSPTYIRARVIAPMPSSGYKDGFSPLETLAISSPIYARHMLFLNPSLDPAEMWVRLRNTKLPPIMGATGVGPDGRRTVVHSDERFRNLPGEFSIPSQDQIREVVPEWQY